MRVALRAWATAAIAAALAGGLAGCSRTPPEEPAPPGLDAQTREALRLRAETGFARGWMTGPDGGQSGEDAFTLAPILIQATSGAAPRESPTGIGAVSRDADGRLRVDPSRPTLYWARSTATIAGLEHDRWSYVWWKAASPTDHRVGNRQGIRMTLDATGAPFLWEVLSDSTGGRLFFTDRALEEAASAEFGPPYPGRDNSLARSLEETPFVLIVRLIESGATPLGPFVYLAEDGRDVCTLLCRCMPSEVDEIVGQDAYALAPVLTLGPAGVDPPWNAVADGPEQWLRLPAGGEAQPTD